MRKTLLKEEKYIPPLAQQLQQKWREKQVKIFFEEGRPIYGRYINGILVEPTIRNIKMFR